MDGEKKKKMRIDSMDPEVSITVSTDTLDPVNIAVSVDNTISASSRLTVFDSARVILSHVGVAHVGS